MFASAYLGARPIVEALEEGADVVITGRVADAALFLGAAAHAHGWQWDDWDRLAAGTLVGHLLECSGQVAGGNYSGEWWTIPHPWDLPYPIAEVEADGSAVITKPKDSGGRVDFDTVRHQLLYEVHDPAGVPLARRRRRLHVGVVHRPRERPRARRGSARRAGDADVQSAARVPRRLVGRGSRRVLVAGHVREGEGHGRAPGETGRDGRARRRRVVLRVLGRERARRTHRAAARTTRPRSRSGPRGDAPTNARRHSSAASSSR